MNNNLFDDLAKKYDSKERVFLANKIQNRVYLELDDSLEKILLDYGSGTGLVSLNLTSMVNKVYLVDSSEEMTQITNHKIKDQEILNAKALCHNLMTETLDLKADIILVSLVLLHIPDTQKILEELYRRLNDHGKLIIVDFDLNDKINDSRVHNGFDKKQLASQLTDAGFTNITAETFYQGEKIFMKEDASLCLTVGYK